MSSYVRHGRINSMVDSSAGVSVQTGAVCTREGEKILLWKQEDMAVRFCVFDCFRSPEHF
jgi:hypothetical protein